MYDKNKEYKITVSYGRKYDFSQVIGHLSPVLDCNTNAEIELRRKCKLKIRTFSRGTAEDLVNLARTLEGVVALCDIPLEQEKPAERPARMILLY